MGGRASTLASKRTSNDGDTASKKGGKAPAAKAPKRDPFVGADGEPAALHEIAQTRYLNYALSVITSRALPDVRDGLKPVQRRILYTMWRERITREAKHRKCAKIVGDVMGNYHPHGDSAIYDALVRLAQWFSLRVPLVDGSGNFGSLDGDAAAAMRYTECRLTAAAAPLLEELNQDTVAFRPNYDGTRTEPVVLPARLPNLLINGATGIAVGMATNVPPHNPGEICTASIRLLDALLEDKELSSRELCRTVKGPDFPTGGQLVSSAEEIKAVYETGQGSLKLRATWEHGAETKSGDVIVITSIPYAVNKATLVERVAEVITSRKMPLLQDVRDVSTEDVRIELELKKGADPHKVLAYLFKNTPLQVTVGVNLTCLVPTENPEVGRPERLDLAQILWHFLHFRLEVVTKRLEHEVGALDRRIHVLRGFETIFDALDTILKLIRASDGKADAAQKIMSKFSLDAEQTDAILELKLYRLAKLEILVIQKELDEKRKRAKEIRALLAEKSGRGRWALVRGELEEVQVLLGSAASKRRTLIEEPTEEPEFSAEDLIVEEDAHVLLSADGWVKRQREIKDPSASRLREGDRVLACFAGSTKRTALFLSNQGTAYTARIADIPATTGYGEPIQKLFKLKDGERIVQALSLDPRVIGSTTEVEGYFPESYGFAATSDGLAVAFGLSGLTEASTKAGRRYIKLGEGQEVVTASVVHGDETLIAASESGRVLLSAVTEVSFLSGPGKGVSLIKLAPDDRLVAVKAATEENDTLVLETSLGGQQKVSLGKYEVSSRGGRGRELIKRGKLVAAVPDEIPAPAPFE